MNMFRNLLMVVILIFAFALWLTDPGTWTWVQRGGPQAVEALKFLTDARPFSYIVLFVIAVALWMTRKQY